MAKDRLKFYKDSMVAYLTADMDEWMHKGEFLQAKRELKSNCKEYYEVATQLKEHYTTLLLLYNITRGLRHNAATYKKERITNGKL